MSTSRQVVLFDLFGVIALQQRPGALAQMAACCDAPAKGGKGGMMFGFPMRIPVLGFTAV